VRFDNKNGEGRIVGEASSGGADPCSVLATEDELIVANYASGSVAFIPLLPAMPSEVPHAVNFGEPVIIQLKYNTEPDSKRNQARQEASHAHQAILHPTSEDLLVPNLGADEVCRFQKTDTGKWESVRSIQYKTGGGPRHVAFYQDKLYTLLELTNDVITHNWSSLSNSSKPAHTTISTLPDPHPEGMFAAEILVSKATGVDGLPHLYVSNREDTSEEGDTIAIFSLVDKENGKKPRETPELVKQVKTGLRHVRGMSFGGAHDQWLIAGGVNNGGVKIFKRVKDAKGDEDLEFVAENKGIEKPTAFVWL